MAFLRLQPVANGADNDMMVIDSVAGAGLDGAAEQILDAIAITVNKQVIPYDLRSTLKPSGVRLGSPAATTRAMGATESENLLGS